MVFAQEMAYGELMLTHHRQQFYALRDDDDAQAGIDAWLAERDLLDMEAWAAVEDAVDGVNRYRFMAAQALGHLTITHPLVGPPALQFLVLLIEINTSCQATQPRMRSPVRSWSCQLYRRRAAAMVDTQSSVHP